jgi:hypothetical protein
VAQSTQTQRLASSTSAFRIFAMVFPSLVGR